MKLRLIRAARIRHEAGEIVEVSPAEAGFLLSTGSAEIVAASMKPITKETPEAEIEVTETPEAEAQKETPEAKTQKKATRAKK